MKNSDRNSREHIKRENMFKISLMFKRMVKLNHVVQ